MNTDRIKELQDFANDFNRRLKISEESEIDDYKLPLKKILRKPLSAIPPSYSSRTMNTRNNNPFLNQNQNNPKLKRTIKSCKKPQKKLDNNFYKSLLPWIPPHYVGNYFENFKILKDKHTLSAWEKVCIIFLY